MIFRKVYIKEKPPTKTDSYITNLGWNHFSVYKGRNEWSDNGNIENVLSWWMEEIELPTDEELEKIMPTKGDFPIEVKIDNGFRQQGAILMRMRVLAVTPNEVQK